MFILAAVNIYMVTMALFVHISLLFTKIWLIVGEHPRVLKCCALPPHPPFPCYLRPIGLTLAHCSLAFCQSWFLTPFFSFFSLLLPSFAVMQLHLPLSLPTLLVFVRDFSRRYSDLLSHHSLFHSGHFLASPQLFSPFFFSFELKSLPAWPPFFPLCEMVLYKKWK